MANITCGACSLPNPDTAVSCRRCGTALAAPGGSVWRDGKTLILKKGTPLPERCIRCNAEAPGGIRRTFHWHSPAIYLLVPLGLLIYAIVAMVVRKSVTLQVGLCPGHRSRYRWAQVGSALVALVGVVLLVLAVNGGGLYGWTGLALILGAAVWGSIEGRMLKPTRIDDNFAHFRGVCTAYLSPLPSWTAFK